MTFHQDIGFQPAPVPQQSPQGVINLLTGVKNYQAQQAQANAYGAAIDPVTGAFDQAKYNAALASTPQGLWGAGPALQQAGQSSEALGRGSVAQIEATHAQLQNVAGWLTPLMNQDGPVTPQQMYDQLDQAHKSGAINDTAYAQGRAMIAAQPPGVDGKKLVSSILWMTQSAQDQLKSTYPNYQPYNIGGKTVMLQVNPRAAGYGQPASGLDIGHTISPDTAAQVVDIRMSDGTVQQVQVGAVGAFLTGNPGSSVASGPHAPPGGGGGGGGGSVNNSNFQNGGRYSKPGGNQVTTDAGPPVTPVPASPVAGGGTVQVPQPKPPVPAAPAPPAQAPPVIGTDSQGRPITAAPPPAATPPNLLQPPPSGGPISVQNLPPPTNPPLQGPGGDTTLQGGGMTGGPPGPPVIPPPGPPSTYAPGSTQGPGYAVGSATPAEAPAPALRPSSAAPPASQGPSGPAPYATPPRPEPPVIAGRSPSTFDIASRTAVTVPATKAYNDLQTRVTGAKDQIALIDAMRHELDQGGWTSGFGSTAMSTVRQAAMFFGFTPGEPGKGVDLATPQGSQEEFTKLSAQLAAKQLAATGNTTDARQELVESMTPGALLTKYGNKAILAMLKGSEIATQAEGDAWQKAQDAGWKAGVSENNNFNTWRNTRFLATDPSTGGRFDPRVFWVGSLPNYDEQAKYLQKMAPDEVQQFRRNMQYAKNQGWLGIRDDGSVTPTVGQ